MATASASSTTAAAYSVADKNVPEESIVKELTNKHATYGTVTDKKGLMEILLPHEAVILAAVPAEMKAPLEAAMAKCRSLNTRQVKSKPIAKLYYDFGMAMCTWKNSVKAARGFPSCFRNNQPALEAVNKIAMHYSSAFAAAKVDTIASLKSLEVRLQPAQLIRKLGEATSTIPLDSSQKICPYCDHKMVDAPASNDHAASHNIQTNKAYNQLCDTLRPGLEGPTKIAMLDGKPIKKMPAAPSKTNRKFTLMDVILQCHCHQMENMGNGDVFCLHCKDKPGFIDGTGNNNCPVCNCDCNKAWQLGMGQALKNALVVDADVTSGNHARVQALQAQQSHMALGQIASGMHYSSMAGLEAALKANGQSNIPEHVKQALQANVSAQSARMYGQQLADGGSHDALKQLLTSHLQPSSIIPTADGGALNLREIGKSTTKGHKAANNRLTMEGLDATASIAAGIPQKKKAKKGSGLRINSTRHVLPAGMMAGNDVAGFDPSKSSWQQELGLTSEKWATSSPTKESVQWTLKTSASLPDDQTRRALAASVAQQRFEEQQDEQFENDLQAVMALSEKDQEDAVDIMLQEGEHSDEDDSSVEVVVKKRSAVVDLTLSPRQASNMASISARAAANAVASYPGMLMSTNTPKGSPIAAAASRIQAQTYARANDDSLTPDDQEAAFQTYSKIKDNKEELRDFVQSKKLHTKAFSSPEAAATYQKQSSRMEEMKKKFSKKSD